MIGKPSSARVIAGREELAPGQAAVVGVERSISFSVPGTPTERPPTSASQNSRGVPSGPSQYSGVAAAGAVSRPSKVVSSPRAASQ